VVPVTMKDVARVASVSATTVSHVLNGSRKVAPETEKAVLDAIALTGYSGDSVARSLRRGATETIGLALSAISNPYFAEVVHALEPRLAGAGYSLMLSDTHDDPQQEQTVVSKLVSRRVDAMIIAPSAAPGRSLDLLDQRQIPTVLIDRVPNETRAHTDAIGVLNIEPTAQLVDHLALHGHRRIGLITSQPGITTTEERTVGYWAGIRRNGLDEDDRLVCAGDGGSSEITEQVDSALERLLSLDAPPTALVLGNNKVGIGSIRALHARGLRIPEDIAVVMFDDFPWSDLFQPRITAISQPIDELGQQAASLLLERLDDPSLPPRRIRLQPVFKIRESCGCLPGSSLLERAPMHPAQA
jgi:LacI family transcriptional regulator